VSRAEVTNLLREQPVDLFLDVLRELGGPVKASAIQAGVVGLGADTEHVRAAWKRAQPRLKEHRNVRFDPLAKSYAWVSQPATELEGSHITSADEALAQLVRGRLTAQQRANLGHIVRQGLDGVSHGEELETLRRELAATQAELARVRAQLDAIQASQTSVGGTPQEEYERAAKRRAAREMHARMDAMRALANLATEVEELAAKRADPDVFVEYARTLVAKYGLEPIERVGTKVAYNPERHTADGAITGVGAPAIVVRPGYIWNASGEAHLISKAVVAMA